MTHSCDGLKLLLKEGFISGGDILNLTTGETTFRPVLRRIKESKTGRLTVGQDWCYLNYCPACGKPMEIPE